MWVQDSNLVYELVKTQCKILNTIGLANVTGVTAKDILQRGQGITLLQRAADASEVLEAATASGEASSALLHCIGRKVKAKQDSLLLAGQ